MNHDIGTIMLKSFDECLECVNNFLINVPNFTIQPSQKPMKLLEFSVELYKMSFFFPFGFLFCVMTF